MSEKDENKGFEKVLRLVLAVFATAMAFILICAITVTSLAVIQLLGSDMPANNTEYNAGYCIGHNDTNESNYTAVYYSTGYDTDRSRGYISGYKARQADDRNNLTATILKTG